MPRHVTTRPFSPSSLRLRPALAGLPPLSRLALCAFAPRWRGYLPFLLFLSAPLRLCVISPFPFFPPTRPYTPESEALLCSKESS